MSTPSRRPGGLLPRALPVLVLIAAAAAVPSAPAHAGDDAPPLAPAAPAPQSAAPQAAAPAPRMAAVDLEIRALERRLTVLRRARTDLHAGKGEALATDDDARRVADSDLRAVREVARYEAARVKALAGLNQALAGHDEAKATEARTALDALDARFAEAIAKLEAARDGTAVAKPAAAPAAKPAGSGTDGGERPRKGGKTSTPPPSGDGMSAPGGADDPDEFDAGVSDEPTAEEAAESDDD